MIFINFPGIVSAMEASLDFLKMGTVEGKTVVMQGAGNVGMSVYSFLAAMISNLCRIRNLCGCCCV